MDGTSTAVILNRSIAACWILLAACAAAVLLPPIVAFTIGLLAFSASVVLCVVRFAVGFAARDR